MSTISVYLVLALVAVCSGSSNPKSNGVLRLFNARFDATNPYSSYNTRGVVQVWYNGKWGHICHHDSFGYRESNVICHQLGWRQALWHGNASKEDNYIDDGLDFTIYDLSCGTVEYSTMFQCDFKTTYSGAGGSCATTAVSCFSTQYSFPFHGFRGQIRLTGGDYSNQGLLEVYCNGYWGTVCDDSFDNTAASVVCKQLGYSTYYDFNHLQNTGTRNQDVWYGKLECSSHDQCLTSCGRCPYQRHYYCDHSHDVTVECTINSVIHYDARFRTCDGVGEEFSGSASGDFSGEEEDDSNTTSLSPAAIAGIVISSLAVLVAVVVGLVGFFAYQKKKRLTSMGDTTLLLRKKSSGQYSRMNILKKSDVKRDDAYTTFIQDESSGL